jgi:hypothetical protein
LDAEKTSKVYVEPNTRNGINYERIDDCWLNPFVRVLTENCRADQLEERFTSIAFVIFNYDRCIEHYLYHALQNYYKLSEAQVADLLSKAVFYHPYGSIGPLPWQQSTDTIGFGGTLDPKRLLENSRQIKTFTEGTNPDSSEIAEIRGSIHNSQNVLFLGFAFHKLNMRLISHGAASMDEASTKSNFATALGMSKSDCAAVAAEVRTMRGTPHVEIRSDLTCAAIFSEYSRGISLT